MILLRKEMGHVLRTRRRELGRTLRDVSARSAVSLGYLSEIERGEKEASSELLASVCYALDMTVSAMLREVAANVAREEEASGVVVAMATDLPIADSDDPEVETNNRERESRTVDVSAEAGRAGSELKHSGVARTRRAA